MAIGKALGWDKNPFYKGFDENRQAISRFALGLGQGNTPQKGLQYGLAGAIEGSQIDRERQEAAAALEQATAQKNQTLAFLQANAPKYAGAVEAGVMSAAEAYSQFVAESQPKAPDLMTVGAGESVIDRSNPGAGPLYTGAPDPSDAFSMQSGLSKEYTANPNVQAYEGIKAGYEKVQTAAQQGSGAGDMSMIFGFMKMLDPTSTVREGEYASAQDTGGIPAQIVNLYNKALNGQFLTPEQRADFLRTADGIYSQTVDNLTPVNDQFTTRANQFGVDPTTFLRTPEVYKKPGGGITGKTSTGITYEFAPGG